MESIRRKELIKATTAVMHESGLSEPTLAAICARAGLSSSSIVNHYFKSKQELLECTMHELAAGFLGEISLRVSAAKSPIDKVRAVIDANFAPSQCTPEAVSAWLWFWGRVPTNEAFAAIELAADTHIIGELKRALQVFSALRAQSTDDPEALLIEAPHVEGDQPAAMSPDGHEPASRREAFERAWPEGRIGDVLEDCVSSVASRDPLDLSLEILSAIVHSEIGAKRHGELDALVRPGGRDDMSPQALRDLYQAAAQATCGAHDQRPVPCLEIGQMAFAESQREMPRDDCRMSEGEPFGKRHAVDARYFHVLRVSTPALDP